MSDLIADQSEHDVSHAEATPFVDEGQVVVIEQAQTGHRFHVPLYQLQRSELFRYAFSGPGAWKEGMENKMVIHTASATTLYISFGYLAHVAKNDDTTSATFYVSANTNEHARVVKVMEFSQFATC
jgi:hypothetical protein